MKFSIKRQLFILAGCFGIGAVQAQEVTTFAQPAEYCFWQTEMRGDLEKTILEHHLLVAEQDYFKTGDVFVAARFNSQPGKILLTNGISWKNVNAPGPLTTYGAYDAAFQPITQLQPVIPISVFFTPADLRPFTNDAQILVGYGLRAENESSRVAFDEMLASKRYDLLWDVGKGYPQVRGLSYKICLTATGMEKNLMTLTIDPVVVGEHTDVLPTSVGP